MQLSIQWLPTKINWTLINQNICIDFMIRFNTFTLDFINDIRYFPLLFDEELHAMKIKRSQLIK